MKTSTDKLVNIITSDGSKKLTLEEEYEELQRNRIDLIECLDKVSDTHKHGMLLLLQEIISRDEVFKTMPMGTFVDIMELIENYKSELCKGRIELRGVREDY